MMTFEWIGDLCLLGTSGTAALYCAVLSRRLRDLRDAKGGIGQALEQLNAGVAMQRDSARATQTAADEAVQKLRAVYAELDEKHLRTEDLIGMMDGQAGVLERRLVRAEEDASVARAGQLAMLREEAERVVMASSRTLAGLAERSRIELEALGDAVEIVTETTALLSKDTPKPAVPLWAEDVPVRQRPAAEANPFRERPKEDETPALRMVAS